MRRSGTFDSCNLSAADPAWFLFGIHTGGVSSQRSPCLVAVTVLVKAVEFQSVEKKTVALKRCQLTVFCMTVKKTEIGTAGTGESYLNHDAAKQYLSGKSYMNSKYWSNFAIDDVRITYTGR